MAFVVQKVSEAEALVNAGVRDVLVSNQVTDPKKIERLVQLTTRARTIVCVDDAENVDHLSASAQRLGTVLECLVEIDVGADRCGVEPGRAAVALAKKIAGAEESNFPACRLTRGPRNILPIMASGKQRLLRLSRWCKQRSLSSNNKGCNAR